MSAAQLDTAASPAYAGSPAHLPEDVKVLVIAACSRTSLKSLTLASKEWHALVEPVLWRSLCIEPKPTSELAHFALQVAPRIGQYVCSCSIEEWWSTVCEQPKGKDDPAPEVCHEIESLEALLGPGRILPSRRFWSSKLPGWATRVAAVQNALLAKILSALANLDSLSIHGSLAIVVCEDNDTLVNVAESWAPNRAYAALAVAGQQVTRAEISLGADDDKPLGDFARLIPLFPKCTTLQLCFRDMSPDDWTDLDASKLAVAINQLRGLQVLSTTGYMDWARYLNAPQAAAPGLQHLRIAGPGLSADSVKVLGDIHGRTLESLVISDLDYPLARLHDRTLDDFPALKKLELLSAFSSRFLDAFRMSPIAVVNFRSGRHHVIEHRGYLIETADALEVYLPQLNLSPISVDDLLRFCEHHKTTLEAVWIHEGLIECKHKAIRRWLHRRGIAGGFSKATAPCRVAASEL